MSTRWQSRLERIIALISRGATPVDGFHWVEASTERPALQDAHAARNQLESDRRLERRHCVASLDRQTRSQPDIAA